MADAKLISKLAYVPMAKPGFDALDMTAPVLVQLNPKGQWEKSKPDTLDENSLKAVVQQLVNTKAVSAAQSYCCQCAAESQSKGGPKSNYVPIIMMPIYPADQCPFDMECEINKMKESETKPKKSPKAKAMVTSEDSDSKEDKEKKKKKRGFVLQRLTDFDLLSQW